MKINIQEKEADVEVMAVLMGTFSRGGRALPLVPSEGSSRGLECSCLTDSHPSQGDEHPPCPDTALPQHMPSLTLSQAPHFLHRLACHTYHSQHTYHSYNNTWLVLGPSK